MSHRPLPDWAMRKPLRRHGDASDLDIGALRNPLEITLSWADLSATLATSRNRAAMVGAITALATAIVASTIIGLFVAGQVTQTVQADVGKAAIRNCQRTNKVAPAIAGLKTFLESDAAYAQKLADLDDKQRVVDEQAAGLNRNLAQAIAPIRVVPRSIISDYTRLAALDARQATITAELGRLRRDAERLWAGAPHGQGRRDLSLAGQVSLLGQAHCDAILAPWVGRLLFGGAVGAAAAPQIQVHGLQVFLEVIGGLGALGALIAGFVAIYKARSERELNSAQAMALLFEKQRETNLDLLTERDREIERLKSEIKSHTGQQRALREQLKSCLLERQLLSNQVTGLEATIAELRDRLGPSYPHR